MEIATSSTANAVRVLQKTASDVPSNLQSILPASDTRSPLRTRAVLREVLIDALDGVQFVEAAKYFDTSFECDRDPSELRKHITVFPMFVATIKRFQNCMKLTVMHATSLLVGAGWNIQA